MKTVKVAVTERVIDGEIYRILSVARFNSATSGRLSDEVRSFLSENGMAATWSEHGKFGLLLESIGGMEENAVRLFGTKKVGVLVFVNDSEPDAPIDQVHVKKGDVIEIAYTGEACSSGHGSGPGKPDKSSFFESGDKGGYVSPYKRESEWRRPKGAE